MMTKTKTPPKTLTEDFNQRVIPELIVRMVGPIGDRVDAKPSWWAVRKPRT
jgi:hypothetical protein